MYTFEFMIMHYLFQAHMASKPLEYQKYVSRYFFYLYVHFKTSSLILRVGIFFYHISQLFNCQGTSNVLKRAPS
jgi:hypothetical protein